MRRSLLKRLRAILVALVCLMGTLPVGLLSKPAQAVQAPENDDVFDVEAYNGAREDELDVKPLGEFFPPFEFSFNFSFDVDVSGGGLFGGSNTDVSTDLQKILNPFYEAEDQYQKKSSELETPRANISLSTAGITPGSEISATGQPQGFKMQSGGQELFYAWALDNVSLAGVAAGGDSQDLPQAASPRGPHSRSTKSDSDGDGMDDDWEIRYGLNPNNSGDAGQDGDQDGYTNDVYDNEDGEVLIIEPPTSAGPAGGPLTNLKEYIWGTDPTNPDTDGDGFSDGQDIAGLGQVQISFTVPASSSTNDASGLRLTILGDSAQEFDRGKPLVKLDSTVLPLTVRDAEKLDAHLVAVPDAPVPGETVTLTASLGQTDFQPGILQYTWFVNNVPQQEGSGQSKFTFEYTVPATAVPGDVIVFGVSAVNFETEQQAEAQLEVRVGELMQLQFDPTKVESGEEVTITSTMVNNADPTELVFHWYLDDREQVEASGQGKTSATLLVPKGAGEDHDVRLKVTTPDDSALFAEEQTTITVNQPSVSIVLSPESIPLGSSSTAVATAEHFSNEELEYEWSIDGESADNDPAVDAITISGEVVGDHTIGVTVRSVGPGAESTRATATLSVTAPEETAFAPTDGGNDKTTVASVRQAVFGRPLTIGIFIGTFFVVLGIVTALLIRRNALS